MRARGAWRARSCRRGEKTLRAPPSAAGACLLCALLAVRADVRACCALRVRLKSFLRNHK